MIYALNATIPANRPSTNPLVERLQVCEGLIYKVEVSFPPGCAGLAHIVIKDGGYQCWPSTPDVDFASDAYTISFNDTYLKTTKPLEFQVYAYNEDDTWPHTVQIRLGIVSEDIFIARFLPTYAYEHFLNLMEGLKTEERLRQKEVLKNPFPWLKKEGE